MTSLTYAFTKAQRSSSAAAVERCVTSHMHNWLRQAYNTMAVAGLTVVAAPLATTTASVLCLHLQRLSTTTK